MTASEVTTPDAPDRTDDEELRRAVAAIREASIDDAEQALLQQRMLAFCAEHPDALHRSCLEGHLTGSALIVDLDRAQVLLIHHAKLGRWLQPGGHVDGEGDLASAARREAEEETGIRDLRVLEPAIDLDIHAIPERGAEPAHLHLDVRYLVVAPAGSEASINHESLDARWVGLDDEDDLIAGDELRRLVTKGLARAALVSRRRSE